MILRQFTIDFAPRNGHTHKCRACGKLLKAGERVQVTLGQQEKYYPVKGIMKFNSWLFVHQECVNPGQVAACGGKVIGGGNA